MVEKKQSEEAKVNDERAKIAKGGFFLRGAEWLLSRFPLTRNSYQNWTKSRRILVGWLLWIVVLPIIPIVVAAVWYVHDPEGFKNSPWAKALMALVVVWSAYAGVVLTNPSQADVNGKYSPFQTAPNGEVNGKASSANTASKAAQEKVAAQSTSKASKGRRFENCTAAFEAGVFNIKRSDESYQGKLDRDNDGIACEK